MQAETSERRLQQHDAVMGEPLRPQFEAMILCTYRDVPGLFAAPCVCSDFAEPCAKLFSMISLDEPCCVKCPTAKM